MIDLHVREQFFTDLRTQEQSGYIVRSMLQTFDDANGSLHGISFLIQSPNFHPIILRKKIKHFVEKMYVKLQKINDKQFKTYKSIIQSTLMEKFKSQNDEFTFMIREIANGDYKFNYYELLLQKIEKMEKSQLIKFYNKYFIDRETRKLRNIEMYK